MQANGETLPRITWLRLYTCVAAVCPCTHLSEVAICYLPYFMGRMRCQTSLNDGNDLGSGKHLFVLFLCYVKLLVSSVNLTLENAHITEVLRIEKHYCGDSISYWSH